MGEYSLKSGKKMCNAVKKRVQLSVKYFCPYWVTFREKKRINLRFYYINQSGVFNIINLNLLSFNNYQFYSYLNCYHNYN